MKLIFLLITLLTFQKLWALDCPEFETTLENILKRMKGREEVKEAASKKLTLSSERVNEFKAKHVEELHLKKDANRDYMSLMEKDAKSGNGKVVYFDVENSIQKKLNDSIFGEKTMVDAVNTSFMKKFYQNVQNNPELKARVSGEYKDYKSLRLRLSLKEGDTKESVEAMLNSAYKKAVDDFSAEYKALDLQSLTKTRTDDVANPERWFLAGSGDDALEANMAARGARSLTGDKASKTSILKYQEHVESMSKDVHEIESLRSKITVNNELISAGILDKLESGQLIPSKEIIGILRKYKPSDFKSDELYFKAIKSKVKTVFGKDISEQSISDLTNYQRKVDSISPPLFARERTEINLEKAQEGIVSVDFTGVGVDNLYQQMKGLSAVNYQETSKAKMLKEAFTKLQGHVDQVTDDMNKAKRYFTESVQGIEGTHAKPLFSGDDGIHMPETTAWNADRKVGLVQNLSKAEDPSKYRVTFVKSKYTDGSIIPKEERSKLIVRAETVEKKLREEMIGIDRFSYADSKKIMTAIDFTPAKKGGTFNVIIGGKNLSDAEKKMIEDLVKKTLKTSEGEIFGEIIFAK